MIVCLPEKLLPLPDRPTGMDVTPTCSGVYIIHIHPRNTRAQLIALITPFQSEQLVIIIISHWTVPVE